MDKLPPYRVISTTEDERYPRVTISERLPAVNPDVVDEFVDFLFSIDEKLCRPPRQAAKLLAFVVQLHKAPGGPLPFPKRKDVAEHLGISVPTVDAVLNVHLAEGNLRVEERYRDGNIKQRRASAIKERYIVPCEVLIQVFDHRDETRRGGRFGE